MRLITWNCQGALRKKIHLIEAYGPDIVVIQECEDTRALPLPCSATSNFWYSDGARKGICVLCHSTYTIELLPQFNPEFRYVLPLLVTRDNDSFLLFAVWAMNNIVRYDARYIGQVWYAMTYYSALLSGSCIVIGDFNSNVMWDAKRSLISHAGVVARFEELGILSAYHTYFGLPQGNEPDPTLYLQRNKMKPYHIDYCFMSKDKAVKGVEIGAYEKWTAWSDHMPLIVDLESEERNAIISLSMLP